MIYKNLYLNILFYYIETFISEHFNFHIKWHIFLGKTFHAKTRKYFLSGIKKMEVKYKATNKGSHVNK